MTTSRYPDITDELLSAYIDGAVTGTERIAVEQAVQDDPNVAWRLSTLQETVRLLRSLPAVQAPRSFVLTAEQLGQAMPEAALSGGVSVERVPVAGTTKSPPTSPAPGIWERITDGWRGFWQGGSPALRNAMAASMAALLLLLIVPSLLSTQESSLTYQAQPSPAGDALMSQVTTLSAKELQRREVASGQSAAPAQEAAVAASEAEAPAVEQAVIEMAVPEPALDRAAVEEGMTAESAAPAVAEMVAAAPAPDSARVMDSQPSVAAAAAMPAPAAEEDVLAFAPSAAGEAEAGAAAPALAAAAPAGEELGSAAADEAVLSPTATALPEAAASVESPASAESQPAAEEAAMPATQMPVATPTALSQPESPAPAVVMAPVATRVQPSTDNMARIAVERQSSRAAQPASSPATQNPMWLWAQLAAAAAMLVFGLLWWRSRRTA